MGGQWCRRRRSSEDNPWRVWAGFCRVWCVRRSQLSPRNVRDQKCQSCLRNVCIHLELMTPVSGSHINQPHDQPQNYPSHGMTKSCRRLVTDILIFLIDNKEINCITHKNGMTICRLVRSTLAETGSWHGVGQDLESCHRLQKVDIYIFFHMYCL